MKFLLYIRSKKWCGKGSRNIVKKEVNSRTFWPWWSSSSIKLKSQSLSPVTPVVPSVLQQPPTINPLFCYVNWSDTSEKSPKVYKILCSIFICAKWMMQVFSVVSWVPQQAHKCCEQQLVTVITQMTIAQLTLLLQQAQGPTTTLSMRRVSPTWNTHGSKTIHIQTRKNSMQDSKNAPPLTRCSSWYQEAEFPVNHVVIRHECAPRTIVHEEHHWGFQPTEQVSMLIHHKRWTSVG